MSNTIDPVELEFLLKSTNFKAEAEKMKSEISGVVDYTKVAAKVMTDSMGDFSTQSAKQMKESIAIQKQVIKDLQQSIRELQITANTSTGQRKIDATSALGIAKKDLIAEQGALLMMQKELTLANETEAASQIPIISGLGKWVIGLASVATAMKIGKDIIESTEATAHKFEQTITAAKSATHYFFQSIASGDWSNFLDGLDKAVSGAVEYVNKMEEVNNLANQDRIASNVFDKQIAAEREKTYDKSKANDKERLAAYDAMILLTEQKYSMLIETAEKKRNALLEKASSDTGGKVSAAEIQDFISQFRSLEDGIKLGEEYNKQKAIVDKYTDIVNQAKSRGIQNSIISPQYDEAIAKLNELGEAGEKAGQKVKNISKITFPIRDEISKSIAEVVGLEAQKEQGNTFIKRSRGALENRIENDAAEQAKKAQELANQLSRKQIDYDTEVGRQRLANQIEIEQTLLNAKKDSAEKQRQQADIDFKRALLDIANQKESQLKKLNEANGGIDLKTGKKTASYVSVLPEEDQKQIDQKIIAAETLKNAIIDQINEKEAEKIKEIWREVTDYRLTGIEKEKAAVKAHYDDLEKIAKKAGDSAALAAIPALRKNANDEIDRKYDLQELDFLEKVEIQKNEIQAKGFDREAKLEKANYESWVRIQKQKIEILKKSTNSKDQQTAILLENEIEIKAEERKAKIRQQILDYSREFTNELINQLDLTQEQNKMLQGVADTLYNLTKGDYLAAGFSGVSTLFSLLKSAFSKSDGASGEWVYAGELQAKNMANLLEKQQGLLEKIAGVPFSQLASKQLKDLGSSIDVEIQKFRDLIHISGETDDTIANKLAELGISETNVAAILEAYSEGLINLGTTELDQLNSILEKQKQVADLMQDSFRQALGLDSTDVAGSIIQGIEDGLELSESGLGTWAESFGEQIKTALVKNIKDALELKLTEGFMTDFTKFMSATSEGGTTLTPAELAELEKQYAAAVGDSTAAMAALQPILAKYGVDITNSSSALTGISASVTEDTMSAFIGLMTAVRIDIKSILVSMAAEAVDMGQLVGYAKTIAENTSHNFRLKAIEEGIANTNRILNDKLG